MLSQHSVIIETQRYYNSVCVCGVSGEIKDICMEKYFYFIDFIIIVDPTNQKVIQGHH